MMLNHVTTLEAVDGVPVFTLAWLAAVRHCVAARASFDIRGEFRIDSGAVVLENMGEGPQESL
jgi:hypothetical protein